MVFVTTSQPVGGWSSTAYTIVFVSGITVMLTLNCLLV